jgi:hypothetical protein
METEAKERGKQWSSESLITWQKKKYKEGQEGRKGIPHHAIKVEGGSRGIPPLILNLGIR